MGNPHGIMITVKEGALDELKAEHGITSDAELAGRLGISPPLLSQVRLGRRGVGPAFLVGMLAEFGLGFHLDEGSIYDVKVTDPRFPVAAP